MQQQQLYFSISISKSMKSQYSVAQTSISNDECVPLKSQTTHLLPTACKFRVFFENFNNVDKHNN